MCKPVLTNQPIDWSPGFHCSNRSLAFDRLYLFHLHWADLSTGLQRLTKTRHMPWAGDGFGGHQRLSDAEWLALFHGMAVLPQRLVPTLDPADPPMQDWIAKTTASGADRSSEIFNLDLSINAPELWSIPPHFRDRL